MGFTIPSSKSRLHLSGADWIVNVLDYILKGETCAGNMSQVVMALEGSPDREDLKKLLQKFINAFPVLHGSISRDYNLAPYWKIPAEKKFPLDFNYYDLESTLREEALGLLNKAVNEKFSSENSHLTFHLIRADREKSFFAMTFDHRLFDGRGAEMFLDLLQQFISSNNDRSISDGFRYSAPANLDNWMKQFMAGRNVNRKMVSLSKLSTAALTRPSRKDNGFKFRVVHFNEEETKKIYEDAFSRAGYLMETPYLLSAVIGAFHQLFETKGLPGDACLVPVSVDMRNNDDFRQELFFNHVSYLFYQVPLNVACDSGQTINMIKNQMYDQIKSGMPKDVVEASLLTRIAPPELMKRIFKIPVDGKLASFCFSHVGKSSYQQTEFMGIEISNIFHMPRVPVPPGLGIFFNNYKDRLNMVISCLDGLLDRVEVESFESALKERLERCRT